MNTEQNDAESFQWTPVLNGGLPDLVEPQHDASLSDSASSNRDTSLVPASSVRAHKMSYPSARTAAMMGFGKFSSARRRIYAGIGNALYSYVIQARMSSRLKPG